MKNLKQYFPDWISTTIILTAIVIVSVMSVECQTLPATPSKGTVVIWKDAQTHNWMSMDSSGTLTVKEAHPCGVERMPVKTLHDKDAKLIQWGTIKQATVAEVIRNAAPPNVRLKSSNDHRLAWEEKVVWQITGEIVGFKLEEDQDFHVVIRDVKDHTKTMVVELVAPECIAEPYKSVTAQYRSILEMTFGKATHEFKYVTPERIVVTGPGFYDFIHGQKGVAPNGFEIHPVVQLEAEDDGQ